MDGAATEQSESQQEETLTLESKDSLDQGEGFYEQPPFNKLVEEARDSFGIEGGVFAHLLTNFSKDLQAPNRQSVYEKYNSMPTLLRAKRQVSEFFKSRSPGDIRKVYGEDVDKETLFNAATEVASKLGEFPYWSEYISYKFDINYYDKKGEFKTEQMSKSPYENNPTPTYAKWVSDKLAREKRIVTAGIEEVFPQDFSDQSNMRADIGPAQAKRIRRYKILKASGLNLGKK